MAAAGVSLQVLLVRGLCSEGDPRLPPRLRISVPVLLVQEGGVLRHGDGRDSHKVRKILCLKNTWSTKIMSDQKYLDP